MTQISQVTDHQVVHMDDIDRVASMFLPMCIVMIRGNAGDEYIADLVLAGSSHDTWIATHSLNIVMSRVGMAYGNNRGVDLAQQPGRIPGRGSLLRRERV